MTQTALNVSPDPVLELATAFMGSQQLISAARIGLFAALADGPLTSAQLAEATKRSEHQVRILADSMAAHGLLVRTDGSYSSPTWPVPTWPATPPSLTSRTS